MIFNLGEEDMYDSLPKSVSIFGHDFKIVLWTKRQAKNKKLMGQCHNTKCEIRLAPGLDQMSLCNTLIHEINHGIFWFMSLSGGAGEEVIVNSMTNGLMSVLKANPELLKFLFVAVSGVNKTEAIENATVPPIPESSQDQACDVDKLSNDRIINSLGVDIPMYKTMRPNNDG